MLKTTLLIHLTFFLITSTVTGGNNTFSTDSIRAEEYYNSGVYAFRDGEYQKSIESFLYAAQLRSKLYTQNSYKYGVVQNALGISYKNFGDLNKSIEHFLKAEQAYLADVHTNATAISRLYNNIGTVYKSKLNYGTALDYFERAVNKLQENNSPAADIADFIYNIADINYLQGNFDEALILLDKHLETTYQDTRLYFLSLKAAIYQELNQVDKADDSYKAVIRYAENYYGLADPNIIFEYLNYADFLIKYDKLDEAEPILNQTLKIFEEKNINDGILYALYLKRKGYFYESKTVETNEYKLFIQQKSTNLQESINYYQKALLSLRMQGDELEELSEALASTLSLTQSMELLKLIADTYMHKADLLANSYQKESEQATKYAFNYYLITADLLHQARNEIYSDESKIQLGELEEATHHKIIQTAWKLNVNKQQPEISKLAFTSSERIKASSLYDKLSEQLARNNSFIPDSLAILERTLNYNITSQSERLYNLRNGEIKNPQEIASLDSALFQNKKQRDELYQYIENNFADYYEMKYANSMLNIDEVHQKLKNDEIIIEYVLNETGPLPELYAFFLSSDEYGFYKLNADTSFIPSLEEVFRFLSSQTYLYTTNSNSKSYCISAHVLYKTLLEPFESRLKNKNITIIPDGKLSYLPFEALLTELPDTAQMIQFNDLSYLIRHNTINYSYSANLLFKFIGNKYAAKKRMLAFAPTYNSDTIKFDNETIILPPLPGVVREVKLVGSEMKSTIFMGNEATEENFRNECQNYGILHLAMHAFINDSLPAYSRFAFTQNQESDPDSDGWLNTADIYNLDLNARLTVLSACNTGSGSLRKGEGIMSLARGFLYAGCPSIIMSLWEVEDNAGTEIMHSFYKYLKKGNHTDEALRQAKLAYLENANPRMAHPHYWLGYVSIGDSEPLFRSNDYYFFGLIILLIGALATDQLLLRKKSIKRR